MSTCSFCEVLNVYYFPMNPLQYLDIHMYSIALYIICLDLIAIQEIIQHQVRLDSNTANRQVKRKLFKDVSRIKVQYGS